MCNHRDHPKGNYLHKHTSYDIQIVKIGPAQRFTQPPNPMLYNAFQSPYNPNSAPYSGGIYIRM